MQAVKSTVELIQRQLSDFSTTARLLIAALVVILVMTLLLVALATSRTDYVPLGIGSEPTGEVKARVVGYLQTNRIDHKPSGDDILVPASRKISILQSLSATGVISPNQIDFDELVDRERSIFEPRETSRRKYLVQKMKIVSQFLSDMEGVDSANVVIDTPSRQPGLGRNATRPSATVFLKPMSTAVSRRLADAVAAAVAGAEATLDVERVTVIDAITNRQIAVRGEGEIDARDYLETKEATEQHYEAMLENVLSWIPGVIVEVSAQVNANREQVEKLEFDEPKIAPVSEESTEFASTVEQRQGEVGVRPNAGQAVAPDPQRVSSTTNNGSSTAMTNAYPQTRTVRERAAGEALRIDATVMVPKSWLVDVHRAEQGAEVDAPDGATLQAIADARVPDIQAALENLLRTDTADGAVPGEVRVVTMEDRASMADAGVSGYEPGAVGSGFIGTLVSDGIIGSASLAALAAVSVGLMLMMVRRASRHEEMPSAEELVGIPPALAETESDLVGEVEETDAAMEGLEISEDEVRRHQMLEQINDLANSAPDEAANLLRKWIRTDDQ